MIKTTIVVAALAFAVMLSAAPAQAQAARTFVSGTGSDSNNCTTISMACRHFAAAYAATAANGEIDVLDPANYGSFTITGPVSIEGLGWASIAPVSGGAAITINANPGDKINIIGLVLDGTALASTNGIIFNSGGSLAVRDSVIRNFSGVGIDFVGASTVNTLFVSNTLISDNGDNGIAIGNNVSGTTIGVLDHVALENNALDGLIVSTPDQTINITVSDSVIANNGAYGILALANGATPVSIMVRNSTIANNNTGLIANGNPATLRVTRSTITGNATAWAVMSGGAVASYGDNNIDGNGSVNTAPPSIGYK
jgi:hypothetical protein